MIQYLWGVDMEKLTKDGKVAVLVSRGYGAGMARDGTLGMIMRERYLMLK